MALDFLPGKRGRYMIPLHWRLKKHRYELVGNKCACGELHFPPRMVCPSCGSENQQPFRFAGSGSVVSYTIIQAAPSGFEGAVPYCIALVKLDEGQVISAEVVNFENVVIGKRVCMVFRKQGETENGVINYSFKFSPTE